MTTTISSALGHVPLMTQQGVGATPGYDAIDARRFWSTGRQAGVLSAGSYEVTQRGAGANMSVDIAATTGDGALVAGSAVTGQGLYLVAAHSAVINETITAAHATLPRVDRVVLEIKDNQHDSSGSNLAQVRVIAGTATGGATLDNLTGAASVPSSALLLADVHIPATDTTIGNTQIRDRRPWANGAYFAVSGAGGGTYTTTSSSDTDVATTYNVRIECSGAPLEVDFIATGFCEILTGSEGQMSVIIDMDGSNVATATSGDSTANDPEDTVHVAYRATPAAGSHLFKVQYKTDGNGTATIVNTGTTVPCYTIRELVKPNRANNVTTSG